MRIPLPRAVSRLAGRFFPAVAGERLYDKRHLQQLSMFPTPTVDNTPLFGTVTFTSRLSLRPSPQETEVNASFVAVARSYACDRGQACVLLPRLLNEDVHKQ